MIIEQIYKNPNGEIVINKDINMEITDIVNHVLSWNRSIIWGQCPVCSSDDKKIENCNFCNYDEYNKYDIKDRYDMWNLWKYKKYNKI